MTDPDESPGLPWPRTWRGVYTLALACFVLYTVLLTALTHFYP